MKDSHIYNRLHNPQVVKVYLNMIKTYELNTVIDLFNNITKEANDHPKYETIKQAYDSRISAGN